MLIETFLTPFLGNRLRRAMDFTNAPFSDVGALSRIPDGRPRLMYLHVPFCEQLCPYCSFNRVELDEPLARRYFRSLENEVRIYHGLGYSFDSVYIGGGTPTILPEELQSTLRLIHDLWPIRQVSLESNPNHLTPARIQALQMMGIHRLSVGVQSFDDPILKSIGRYETYGSGREIRARLESVAGAFQTLNVDMIFNFPFQTETMLLRDLQAIRELKPDQVTFYPLMAGRRVRRRLSHWGKSRRATEERFYRRICSELSGEYQPASAWCFSRGKTADRGLIDEYIVERDEYAGLGSGSFGYIGGTLYANTFNLPRYIETVERGKLPVLASRRFSCNEQILYDCLMRLFSGRLNLDELNRKYGRSVYPAVRGQVRLLRLIGALAAGEISPHGGGMLELTDRGRYLWVVFMREFFTGVNQLREDCLSRSAEPLTAR